MISMLTPLPFASIKASAMGLEVKEYAWTNTSFLALRISQTAASVQPPLGEWKTATDGGAMNQEQTWRTRYQSDQAPINPVTNSRISRGVRVKVFTVTNLPEDGMNPASRGEITQGRRKAQERLRN